MKIKIMVAFFIALFSLGESVIADVDGMKISSSAFLENGDVPIKYTCEGENISPPIAWQNAPVNTKTFALIYDDPDAPGGTWDHWVLYNIPQEVTSLHESIDYLPEGTKVGMNSWPNQKYDGPCPPSGKHRYFFRLYALDTKLALADKGVGSSELRQAMHGHILAEASLMGLYQSRAQEEL